jgi:hypothetical protein
LGVVAGSLAMMLHAGTRVRRVPATLTLPWSWWAGGGAVGSYYSVRLWLLRVGLYQLNRPQQQADDWMWIVDHTMQLGERKCLIIVGIRQSAWDAEDRVLRHEDVTLIDLQPVTQSTGEVVYQQMEAATAKTGVPRAIISDDGRDLHKGIGLFRQAHPSTAWVYDIKHKTARLLKHELDHDPSWQAFVGQVNLLKQRVSLTRLAPLLPPQQRGKARYMNVEALVAWAEKSLALLDRPEVLDELELDAAVVEEKLGWLRAFAPQVRGWREVLDVMEAMEHYVRHQGIHREAGEALATLLPQPASQAARILRQQLIEFVREAGQQAGEGERLLGSSEVLESIIGKYKQVAGERGQHGLTGIVLSLGALVGRLTVSAVHAAMTTVSNHDVWHWCRSHLGPTVQSLRRRIALALNPEQKQKPLPLPDS